MAGHRADGRGPGVWKAAVLAGLVAGAALGVFHLVLAEPLIERAIELESAASRARGERVEVPVVSRQAQKAGLVLGDLALGVVWGLVFAVGVQLLPAASAAASAAPRGWLVAAAGAWSLAVFPFLKYPANPPGVGEPETVGFRQLLYFGFVALSALGAAAALRLWRATRAGAVALYVVWAVVLYTAMPGNPDAVRLPGQLVWTFRAVALAGLVVFWSVLGGAFAWTSGLRGRRADDPRGRRADGRSRA